MDPNTWVQSVALYFGLWNDVKNCFFISFIFRIAEIFLSWPIWASSNCFNNHKKEREYVNIEKGFSGKDCCTPSSCY